MITRQDFILPHLNGDVYSEKPPLFFWLAAAAVLALDGQDVSMKLEPSSETFRGTSHRARMHECETSTGFFVVSSAGGRCCGAWTAPTR